jgi:hypothetical protein
VLNLPSYHHLYIACLESDVICVYQRCSSQWAHQLYYAGGEVENCDQVQTAGSHGYPGYSLSSGVGSGPFPHHSIGQTAHQQVPHHQMMVFHGFWSVSTPFEFNYMDLLDCHGTQLPILFGCLSYCSCISVNCQCHYPPLLLFLQEQKCCLIIYKSSSKVTIWSTPTFIEHSFTVSIISLRKLAH